MKNAIVLALMLVVWPVAADDRISFNRDVRAILAEHCWQCHGPDEKARQAGLRLDVRSAALRPADSGSTAIVPHDPKRSELVTRIRATDENARMPPPGFGKPLSAAKIETLEKWIAQGGQYQRHWAFRPLTKPVVPQIDGASNPIDAFVATRLVQLGREFSPAATRATLLRRVSFALTGLPPTLEDLDRVDESYHRAVDRLLASTHFGERLTVGWLDAARYADTNGYFGDKPRQMWLWRDWVIDAFNRNMPFDQFTIEQLAGDLLPSKSSHLAAASAYALRKVRKKNASWAT